MSTEPKYFDSQAQAAAVLKISIDDIRQAKRDGCPAFRSGRVRRRELLEWLARGQREPRAAVGDGGDIDWFDRAEKLHGLMFAIEAAYERGALKLGEYVQLAQATMPHVIALAKLWKVEEFDAAGFRKCWSETFVTAVATACVGAKSRNENAPKKSDR